MTEMTITIAAANIANMAIMNISIPESLFSFSGALFSSSCHAYKTIVTVVRYGTFPFVITVSEKEVSPFLHVYDRIVPFNGVIPEKRFPVSVPALVRVWPLKHNITECEANMLASTSRFRKSISSTHQTQPYSPSPELSVSSMLERVSALISVHSEVFSSWSHTSTSKDVSARAFVPHGIMTRPAVRAMTRAEDKTGERIFLGRERVMNLLKVLCAEGLGKKLKNKQKHPHVNFTTNSKSGQ